MQKLRFFTIGTVQLGEVFDLQRNMARDPSVNTKLLGWVNAMNHLRYGAYGNSAVADNHYAPNTLEGVR